MASAIEPRQCYVCEEMFIRKHAPGRDKGLCCSRECGFKWQAYKASSRRRIFYAVLRCLCDECGRRFSARNGNQKICSPACGARRAERVRTEKCRQEHAPRRFDCLECGSSHETVYGAPRSVFCSHQCARRNLKRAQRSAERARLRLASVEVVNPIKVFDRDGWRCQICKAKTPRRLRGSYSSRAPELDHIVPLAQGGLHSYANVQCTCRSCNGTKSNRVYGQLHLFAAA